MTHWLSRFKISCCCCLFFFFFFRPLDGHQERDGKRRGGRECVCVYVWVWEREWEGERGIERVCEGERKIIFSNLLPLFFPPSFLCFSLKLCGLWNTLSSSSLGKWRHFVSLLAVELGRIFLFFFPFSLLAWFFPLPRPFATTLILSFLWACVSDLCLLGIYFSLVSSFLVSPLDLIWFVWFFICNFLWIAPCLLLLTKEWKRCCFLWVRKMLRR